MKKFDVLFIDPVAYKHYDTLKLDREPLGGTEATVVRVAEGLAARGLTVGVVNKHTQEPTMGSFAYFLPLNDDILKYDPDHLVSIRGTALMEQFPKALKYSWHHDYPDARIIPMAPIFQKHDAFVIGVSDFHANELKRLLNNENWAKIPRVKRIYNPLDPRILVPPKAKVAYNRNQMVWAASPHKGLEKAIEQFKIVKQIMPKMELHVYHPGYMDAEFANVQGVMNIGPMPCQQLWQAMSESLCVFYPTDFLETFGLIAAEANAVHTPIATMGIGALNETVQTSDQLVTRNDYQSLIKKIELWYNNPKSRPEVCFQPRFKLESVVDEWLEMFQKRKK